MGGQNSFAFLIRGSTESIDPDSESCRVLHHVIVYDAPSLEAGERWARHYLTRECQGPENESTIAELKIIPIHDRLLTSTGEEPFDWPSLADSSSHYDQFPNEYHATAYVCCEEETADPSMNEGWPDVEAIKKEISDPENYNWDEGQAFYYLICEARQAFVVRAMNMMVAFQPYFAIATEDSRCDGNASLIVLPGARRYSS